ncbi:hypothetical protein J5226_20820 [Lysobacter sp. K5869]|uniref:hypothetical protein n=1 Tax=Lysobacter sp. K5869 TaxID=2820808 RepID=UPI001C0618C6|nr:hypothetical protein [Lysobacter sp. K5869]QWP76016.1 hypothetical protein J5226_20820 [Lysobacter sp. K5869]
MQRIATLALAFALTAAAPTLAFAATAAAPAHAAVETVGEYSNVRVSHSEDPHAYGYTVELYRQNGELFGLLYSDQGLVGDTPRGRLQDLRYDPASGALSFRAKLTLGREYGRESGPDGRPSRDLFRFDGRLSGKLLSGTLEHRDGYKPDAPGEREKVALKFDAQATRDLRELAPASRAAWQAEELPFGPEW